MGFIRNLLVLPQVLGLNVCSGLFILEYFALNSPPPTHHRFSLTRAVGSAFHVKSVHMCVSSSGYRQFLYLSRVEEIAPEGVMQLAASYEKSN